MKTGIFSGWRRHLLRFLMGGGAYLLIEIVWRMLYQHRATHPIIMIPAGTVLMLLCFLDEKKWNIFLSALMGMLTVTCFELVIGLIAIHAFDTYLWDYGGIPGNFMRVVCPRWSLIWYGACFGVVLGRRLFWRLLRRIARHKKPSEQSNNEEK